MVKTIDIKFSKFVKDKIKDINRQLNAEGLFKAEKTADKSELETIRNTLTNLSNRKRFMFVSNFGEKIEINRLSAEKSYTVGIHTLLVKRSMNEGMRAHDGESISEDECIPVSLYDLPYKNPPGDFSNGKETEQIVPGSENIVECDKCKGKNKNSGSSRKLTCYACKGSGEVVRYSYYKTEYSPEYYNAVFSPVEIPHKKMIKDKGCNIFNEIIYDSMKNVEAAWMKLSEFECLSSAVEKLLNEIRSILKEEEDIAIFRIRLSVQDNRLRKVGYTFRNKKQFLWIMGDNLLHAKKLVDWRKVIPIGLVGSVILINGLIYAARIGYNNPKSNQEMYGVAKQITEAVDRKITEKPTIKTVTGKKKKTVKKNKKELLIEKTIKKRKYLFNKGVSQFKEEEIENSYNSLKSAIDLNKEIKNNNKIDPPTSELYFYLGEVLMRFENYREAIAAYEVALIYDSNHDMAEESLERARVLESINERKK